jgi:hypothetical protein
MKNTSAIAPILEGMKDNRTRVVASGSIRLNTAPRAKVKSRLRGNLGTRSLGTQGQGFICKDVETRSGDDRPWCANKITSACP